MVVPVVLYRVWKRMSWLLLAVLLAPVVEANIEPRIVGGSEAPSAYPWMVSIQLKNGAMLDTDRHFCSGVLITDSWVLTAGHCATGYLVDDIEVEIGALNINENTAEVLSVARIELHPDYNLQLNGQVDNDIALLELATPSINSILPRATTDQVEALLEGQLLKIMGWGGTAQADNLDLVPQQITDILREAEVPLVTEQQCQAYYRGGIDGDVMCAGYDEGGIDSCLGDSGGPLLWQDEDSIWKQVGIVSYGDGCAKVGAPSVYTNTASYSKWISQYVDDVIIEASLDFGYVGVGLEATATFELINKSDADVAISDISITGTNQALFSISDNRCSLLLSADSRCEIEVTAVSDVVGLVGEANLVATTDLAVPVVEKPMSVTVLAALDVSRALQLEGVTWYTGGDIGWSVQSGEAYYGSSALRSGNIGHNQRSVLLADVSGPNDLTLAVKLSTEEGFDNLLAWEDGVSLESLSGLRDWAPYISNVSTDDDQYLFVFQRDGSEGEGENLVWIDGEGEELLASDSGGGGSIDFSMMSLLVLISMRRILKY